MRRSFHAWSLASAVALTLVANAADPIRFDVKLGLWEMTTTGNASGQLPVSADVLAKLPPEQRDRIMAAVAAGASKPTVHKSCLTADKLAESLSRIDVHEQNCQRELVSSTPADLTVTGSCTTDHGNQSFKVHMQRISREEIEGHINVTVSRDGQTMNIERTIKGKWLGAGCGEVK